MSSSALPILHSEAGFFKYLNEIRLFPSLSHEEEHKLAKRLIDHKDIKAAHQLVTSHLKLVAKVASSFRGYGLPLIELVSEGNIGLMQAVKRFNPDLGFRLSTYAMWWIKASIQEYVLKSWSLVKIGTTAAQKKIFFNLNKIRHKISKLENSDKNQQISQIASELNVSEKEVREMDGRLSSFDISLNLPIADDSGSELISMLPETRPNQEIIYDNKQALNYKKSLFNMAFKQLNEREKHILVERHLKEQPSTLEELSQYYKISRERIRQIEAKIFEKLRNFVKTS